MHNLNYQSARFHINELLKDKLKQRFNSAVIIMLRTREKQVTVKNI